MEKTLDEIQRQNSELLHELRKKDPSSLLGRCPRICAHIIAESLGYAMPRVAESILDAAHRGESHFCEWVHSKFDGDAIQCVQRAIRNRHHHHGYMAEYGKGLQVVADSLNGNEPMFASWF